METPTKQKHPKRRLNFEKWVVEANKCLVRDYAITFEMAGLDTEDIRRLYGYNESPQEIVEWFAEKYDLTRVNLW